LSSVFQTTGSDGAQKGAAVPAEPTWVRTHPAASDRRDPEAVIECRVARRRDVGPLARCQVPESATVADSGTVDQPVPSLRRNGRGDAHCTDESCFGRGSLQLHVYSFDRHIRDVRGRADED